ncbi:single-stranded DNA-binding protein, partial [Francisella tularensis subsp. holarctica]
MAKGTVNKVILLGRLGNDPEVRTTQNGTVVATLSIATNDGMGENITTE